MAMDVADALGRAQAITAGGTADVADVTSLAGELRTAGRFDAVAPLLIEAARRAVYQDWDTGAHAALAATLRDHQHFGYARRLYRRLSAAAPGDRELRQQYAFCVYKDMELPATRRLDRALEILRETEDLKTSADAELLGLAGAVYKRRWEVDAKRADLDSARWCYTRGYEQAGHPQREYCGVNAAFILDQLAALDEREAVGEAPQAEALRTEAQRIRESLVDALKDRAELDRWDRATLAESLFGLGRFEEAIPHLERVRAKTPEAWRLETTATQLAAIARLHSFGATPEAGSERAARFSGSEAGEALRALVGADEAALRRAYLGKVGLALSGGGYRASLFHIGTLARLAEQDTLRRVEVLSCVSGGSIVGAFYYLKLRRLLQTKPDDAITAQDYVDLVRELCDEFLEGVQQNLRLRLTADFSGNRRMLSKRKYSRTDRVAELFDELLYRRLPKDDGSETPWLMTDLLVTPAGREPGFSPRYENWRRATKVPSLVLNATTLNTGHNWQFTASWMGEPPTGVDEEVDANPRLRRMYYRDAPEPHRHPRLSMAVGASACVPALFPPVALTGLYDGLSVELVDGGVHDNQGIASLLEQDCSVVLVSDASGQMGDEAEPSRSLVGVPGRANSILMSRVRGAQYLDLAGRLRSGALRRLMIVHLKKGLPVRPRDWHGCPERYDPEQDEVPASRPSGGQLYGIAEDVQRGLAELRTDLDAFSNDEAFALMAAGYQMTSRELARGLPDFPVPDRPAQPQPDWPFRAAIEQIGRPAAETPLGVALPVGRKRFLKAFHAWRARRRSRPLGPVARLLGRARVAGAPATAAVATGRTLLGPLRSALAVAPAAGGAVLTRAYLATFGRLKR